MSEAIPAGAVDAEGRRRELWVFAVLALMALAAWWIFLRPSERLPPKVSEQALAALAERIRQSAADARMPGARATLSLAPDPGGEWDSFVVLGPATDPDDRLGQLGIRGASRVERQRFGPLYEGEVLLVLVRSGAVVGWRAIGRRDVDLAQGFPERVFDAAVPLDLATGNDDVLVVSESTVDHVARVLPVPP